MTCRSSWLVVVVWLGHATACGVANPGGPTFPQAPLVVGNRNVDGYDYCRKISASARTNSTALLVGGWSVSATGIAAISLGGIIPITKEGELEWKHRFGSASLIAGGAILTYLGQALLSRSDASSKLAGATAAILGEKNGDQKIIITQGDAASKCSIALGAWESSRTDATAIASKLLETERREGADAKARVGQADAAVEEAERRVGEAEQKRKVAEQKLEEVIAKGAGEGAKARIDSLTSEVASAKAALEQAQTYADAALSQRSAAERERDAARAGRDAAEADARQSRQAADALRSKQNDARALISRCLVGGKCSSEQLQDLMKTLGP